MKNADPSPTRYSEDYETIKRNFAHLYNTRPAVYDVFARNQILQSPVLDDIERILTAAGITSGSFIDIGCGTGVMIEQLAARFPKIQFTGVDPAETSLTLARARCEAYPNAHFKLGRIEEVEAERSSFEVVFSSWGHIQWNMNGGIMERITKPGGLVLLVNNWGEDDDFEKLWPIEAIDVFRDRKTLLRANGYNVRKLDSYLNLDDESLFDAISAIFGTGVMNYHKKSPFQVGIVLASKQINRN